MRPRSGLALPTVLLLLGLLGVMVAGTLATLRAAQRSGHLRAADVALAAAEVDAAARAADACPDALLTAAPGTELPLSVSAATGPVDAHAIRLSGALALLYGSVTDARTGSPAAGSVRHFRVFVRLRAASPDSAAAPASPSDPVCVAPIASGAWGPGW